MFRHLLLPLHSHQKVFHAWRELKSEKVADPGFSMEQVIRDAHPNHHLTRLPNTSLELLEYASAGHATARRVTEGGFQAEVWRVYCPPSSRVDAKASSALDEEAALARWNYSWDGTDFVVYKVCWSSGGCWASAFFILAPMPPGQAGADNVVVGGHHRRTDALILAVGDYSRELHDEIHVFDAMRWTKSKSLWRSVRSATWDDVILDPAVKAGIMADVEGFFDSRAMYARLKVPWKRGVILHGVPGNGKTMTIKALINSLAARRGEKTPPVHALYVKSLDSRRGSKSSIKSIFDMARLVAPCLLIFEDLDSLVADETKAYFLNEVDGLESNDGILMVGSTNHIDRLDPAVTKRPSRFDRKYHYQLPRHVERAEYARYWRRKFEGTDDVDFPDEACEIIAQMTEGYSFAYMKELFITSLLELARGKTGEEEGTVVSAEEMAAAKAAEKLYAASDAEQAAARAVSVATESGEPKDSGAGSTNEAPAKRTMTEITVPESLRSNLLLRIMRKQAELLLSQIDSASAEAVEKVAVGNNNQVLGTRMAVKMRK
ncbi:hypothetical protein GGTG_06690 [Gaeumannomyces tritici R3-111a-1]|uniref:AAA+ ATPase domain-containing protein n=1 Tax=Gaeumannomyces tritici (strain R3-111a-1) TaxID=644352 RepID=J3NZJ2_GAET3|nr:hypothetical protein GGTG_06690 [Gaeumannomyces tritici R3-111a-1]EJT76775.1 hypothetical protein GGTG_06690 [Gaeumannomyces tritici R3-111a-1]